MKETIFGHREDNMEIRCLQLNTELCLRLRHPFDPTALAI